MYELHHSQLPLLAHLLRCTLPSPSLSFIVLTSTMLLIILTAPPPPCTTSLTKVLKSSSPSVKSPLH
ncbi:unnamed protein product [Brassica oleracea]